MRHFEFFPILTVLTLLTSCNIAPRSEADLPDSNSTMVEAVEWDELKYEVRTSDITLIRTGHFYVDRNSCRRRESGAFELATWNRIATAINLAWTSGRAGPETCVPLPASIPSLGSGVEVQLRNGTKQKFVTGSSTQACAFIGTPEALTGLLNALAEAAEIARQEGC